jgi:hypothetical protein
MSKLWGQIRSAVVDERYIIGLHANEQLRRRAIPAWQIISQIEQATFINERPKASPNPVVEVRQHLADGTPVKAVWAWLAGVRTAKLVTVHFFDR